MEKIVIATHDGKFHTDDVFAAATITLAFPDKEIEILRTRNEEILETADIVFDVGGSYNIATKRFDHHQIGGAGERENGIPYASFGLVWKAYGVQVAGSEENAELLDEQLVQCIDGADSGVLNKVSDKGVFSYTIIDIISALRPTWKEERSFDEAFYEAVNLAIGVITRAIAQIHAYQDAYKKLEKAYEDAEDKRIVEIEKDFPGLYEVMAAHEEPLYVLYERESGGWSVKGIRKDPIAFELRKQLPAPWAGLRDEALQEITGVTDAVFCHTNRFLVVAKTKEGARKLAEIAVNA